MDPLLHTLAANLDWRVRRQLDRRMDLLMRELIYRYDPARRRNDDRILYLQTHEWPLERMRVVCVLNTFYQIVLAPLASAAHGTEIGLGREIPIQYGSMLTVNSEWSREIEDARSAFLAMADSFDIPEFVLMANRADDIVFRLNQHVRQDDEQEGDDLDR
jgi:hypothetical protein